MRAVRDYSDRPVAEESLRRILQAGRVTGSSQNRQPWRFYVVRTRERLDALAETVYEPTNLQGCQVAVGIASSAKGGLDLGRCCQNMILTAWSEGIGSSPNGAREVEEARSILGLAEEESLPVILSFGYPAQEREVREDAVEGLLQRIKRKPLDEIVVNVD